MNNHSHLKIKTAVRNQIEFRMNSLDDLVPDDHRVRVIWDFVQSMDLEVCYNEINSIIFEPGRPKIDPKILFTLWIYTILDGNSSARKIEELSNNHNVYKWICGGVSVNRTSLADFRSANPRKFDELLTSCLAVMVKAKLINDSDFSQDGTRVKGNAGFDSFRSENALENIKVGINEYINEIKLEEKKNPRAYESRQKSREKREILAKQDRINEAIRNLEETRCTKIINGKRNSDIPTENELSKVRASITDPEVRKMKMGDGGFRLAYNVQFATSLDSRVIFGVKVVNTLDPGTPPALMAQVQERLKKLNLNEIKKWIADCAYSAKNDIRNAALLFSNCLYYAPPKPKKNDDPKKVQRGDCEAVKKWRERIGTDEVNEIYKKRCSTAEFSNMQIKNQSLIKFSGRGLLRVNGEAFLHAIAQNVSRYIHLIGEKLKKTFSS